MGGRKSRMKAFANEWVFQRFEEEPSFFTKKMFGGLAVYLFGRMMMVLVEPTRTGRWKWHGVLICSDHAQHPAIIKEFPALAPHDVLNKWLYVDTRHEDFEPTMERVGKAIARDDQRFGIRPRVKDRSRGKARYRK
jgi:hypothetical protein